MKHNGNILNVVFCNGAICVSTDGNYRRYYADGMHHRNLRIQKYEYPKK